MSFKFIWIKEISLEKSASPILLHPHYCNKNTILFLFLLMTCITQALSTSVSFGFSNKMLSLTQRNLREKKYQTLLNHEEMVYLEM